VTCCKINGITRYNVPYRPGNCSRWIIQRTNHEKHPGRLERAAAALRIPDTVIAGTAWRRRNLASLFVFGAGVGLGAASNIPPKRKCFHFSGISFGFCLNFSATPYSELAAGEILSPVFSGNLLSDSVPKWRKSSNFAGNSPFST